MPVKSTVVVKTLRCPGTRAPPKVGSRKYFWASSQVMTSRTCGSFTQDTAFGSGWRSQGMRLSTAGRPIMSEDIPLTSQSSDLVEVRLA